MPKEYFSHDYNSRNKLKMAALTHKYGARGYGLFWIIVEMLHEEETHWMQLKDQTYISIAKQSSCKVDYVKNFIADCISEYQVFIQDVEKFTTERVLRNVEKRQEIKEKRSIAGKESAKVRSLSTSVKQNGTSVEQNPTKERKGKGKEIKEKENRLRLYDDTHFFEQLATSWGIDLSAFEKMILAFELSLSAKEKTHSDFREYKSHFFNWGAMKFTEFIPGHKKMIH